MAMPMRNSLAAVSRMEVQFSKTATGTAASGMVPTAARVRKKAHQNRRGMGMLDAMNAGAENIIPVNRIPTRR